MNSYDIISIINIFILYIIGLPVQVRDEALNLQSEAPNSDINRQYYAQNIAGKVRIILDGWIEYDYVELVTKSQILFWNGCY